MAVTRLEITSREPLAGGRSFGDVGPYESIQGTLHFAVGPKAPASRLIGDIDLTPTGPDGLVYFSSDFHVLRPVQPAAEGRLLCDVINRGRKLVLSAFNLAPRGPETDQVRNLGDGFLMHHGFTVVWCGWQHDVPAGPGQMTIHLPEARDANGPLSGQTYVQYQPNRTVRDLPLCDRAHNPLPTRDLNDPEATLTVREHPDAPAQTIDRSLWQFGRAEGGSVVADPTSITLASGFEPGKIYEIIYNTIGAPVIGLGFLATRDCVAFLRYATADQGNPCADTIRCAYAYGASQTGRYVREFLHLGLNQDERGQLVFDGVHSHTGSSRRGEFNLRFGQPSTNVLRAPGNLFPLTYTPTEDPMTGERSGLLDRLEAQGCTPKIVATNSGMEYWWSGASLSHADVAGTRDVDPPPSVRIYYLAGTQHATGSLPLTDTTEEGIQARSAINTLDYRPMLRAALLNLDRWVREGVEPPPSQYPRLGDGTAVRRETLREKFESIPGVEFPSILPVRRRLDYGREVERGIFRLPPSEGDPYGTFVSAVDADGNDLSGVRAVDLRVPLGTYTGWNLRHPDVGGVGQFFYGNPLIGAVHVFPRTVEERAAAGDPRPAIAERYASRDEYLSRVTEAAEAMAAEGYLLREDVALAIEQAGQRWDAFHAAPRELVIRDRATVSAG